MKVNSYKNLIVWQRTIELVVEIYKLTRLFPKEEQYGIISQMRRAVVSIASNIAEGFARKSFKEYLQFYSIAYGSALELETQLIISKKLEFSETKMFTRAEDLLTEVIKMLYVMVYKKRNL